MRDPRHPLWPHAGDRTELADVADQWRWAYFHWCQSQARQKALAPAPPRTFGQVYEEYLRHREGLVETQTHWNDKAALGHLATDHPPGTIVELLDPQRTLDRLMCEKFRPTSIKTYSAYLSSFFRWLGLPYEVKVPKLVKDDLRVWSDDEVREIRKAAKVWGMLLPIDLGLYVGLRRSEIWGAEWGDVRGRTMRVRRQYPSRPLKGKRARTAVILPAWKHKAGSGRICPQGAVDADCRKVPEIIRAAGLEPPVKAIHSLRHTYSRMFLEMKADLRLLQASLGHASVRTTEEVYDHLLPDRAADLALKAMYRR